MHFSINRLVFLNNLLDVQRAISSKSAIPILTGVKLSLTNDSLFLTGSDTSISIERIITIENEDNQLHIEKTGSIVLPARFFGEIIRKLTGETVSFLQKENSFEIKSDKAVFTINGVSADQYPIINTEDIHDNEMIMLPTALFKNALSQTVIATSTSEQKPILTGINLIIGDKKLIATATDSHRMSRRIIELPNLPQDYHYNVTIPAKSLVELSKILDDQDELSMSISENKVLFMSDNLYFYSRLLEGIYPDISRLLYNQYRTKLTLNAFSFLQIIERASILTNESKNEFVTLYVDENTTISSISSEIGYVEENFTPKEFIGEIVKISFNPIYMKDALKAFGHIDISMELFGEGRPFLLKENDDTSNNFVQLITPVRTIA